MLWWKYESKMAYLSVLTMWEACELGLKASALLLD